MFLHLFYASIVLTPSLDGNETQSNYYFPRQEKSTEHDEAYNSTLTCCNYIDD